MVNWFYERLKGLRLNSGMTQTDLAKVMTVTRTSVNAWEGGLSLPTAPKLIDLAQFFHVSVDYLLGLEQAEVISLDGLDEEQKALIYSMLTYFEKVRLREQEGQGTQGAEIPEK